MSHAVAKTHTISTVLRVIRNYIIRNDISDVTVYRAIKACAVIQINTSLFKYWYSLYEVICVHRFTV